MDHLPECPAPLCDYFDPKGKCMGYEDCEHLCCCAALRACEQRVREEESRNVIGSVSLAAIGEANMQQYQLGYSEALDAAREALDALPTEQTVKEGVSEFWVEINHAIAAIDALREKP